MNDRQIDNLRVGSVIRERSSGKLRIVRRRKNYNNCVSHKFMPDQLRLIEVTISRCSWTGRPSTILCRSDIRTRFDYTGLYLKDIDDDFNKEFLKNTHCMPEDQTMFCCDVKGVA